MKNIILLRLEKYSNELEYQLIEDGVYKDLKDSESTNSRIALSFELEVGDSWQYPLEDILDKFYLHVSDFLDTDIESCQDGSNLNLELAGELEDILSVRDILDKRVYNAPGQDNYVKLVIE
ncbi:hypothetical protein [Bacteroides propionicifaciens]|jgi:hypothetical protein|uniref:hypothetical protein n=1 Tax=Bacteroides propionicifaciens TaxID=392838 RepID=UPI00036D9E26|nr:hypothetical protein [Bacteroides propionicifaciens]